MPRVKGRDPGKRTTEYLPLEANLLGQPPFFPIFPSRKAGPPLPTLNSPGAKRRVFLFRLERVLSRNLFVKLRISLCDVPPTKGPPNPLLWRYRPGGRSAMSLSPTFSPVIYYGAIYAAFFSVCLKSLNHRTVKYASFAAHATRCAGLSRKAQRPFGPGVGPYPAKTLNLTPSSAPRDENR